MKKESTYLTINSMWGNNKKLNVKSLNDLIGQITKTFLYKSFKSEFDKHMEYEKYDQNSRSISNNYRKGKTLKTVKTNKRRINYWNS